MKRLKPGVSVEEESTFMKYVIVDVEATCCNQNSFPRNEMEIIEIGAVALHGETFGLEDEYDCFIRPIRHPQLTQFCTELTSIEQHMVDRGRSFQEGIEGLLSFMNEHHVDHFCSWGDYDLKQFRQDCTYHKIECPFKHGHLNIKTLFARNNGLRKPCGVSKALRLAGLTFNGTAHRGIDDVKNMARLAQYIWGNRRVASSR